MAAPEEMYQCQTVNCGYIYDPDRGDRKGKIAKGTQFNDLPDGLALSGLRGNEKGVQGPGRTGLCSCGKYKGSRSL